MKSISRFGMRIFVLSFIFSFFFLTAVNPSKAGRPPMQNLMSTKWGICPILILINPAVTLRGHHQDCRGGLLFRPGRYKSGERFYCLRPYGRPMTSTNEAA